MVIESEISKNKPYLLNDDFTVTQTVYDIADEDLVINYTATKQVTGAIAMIKEWKYAKSFTSNTITFANSDFEVGVNEISVIDVNYSDGGYGRFTGTIRVTKNISVPVPPPSAVDNPPTISQNIRNQEGVLGDTFTISYVASDDNEIVKHEIFNGSNWLLKTPTSDGNNHSVDIRFTKKGVKNCKIRVTDSKNQIAESNEFSIMVNEIANNTLEIIDTPYIFKDSEKAVLKYRSNSRFTSAYLYGTGETINSESVTTNTITFPALKAGTYTAYVGTYFNGDKLVESNRFELTITKDVVSPPETDNPPTISNNIIDQNGYINDTFIVTYNASDDNNITKHEFYDGNSWIIKNPSKSSDDYTFTHIFENTGQKQCRVKVTDGNSQSASSNIFTINVDNIPSVNNPPVISNVVVTGVDFNGNYTLNWTSTDKDNDNLTHRLKINSDNYFVISPVKVGNTYKYKGSNLGIGSHTCYIEVSDGKQNIISKAFVITIPQKPASLKAELKQAKDNYDLKHVDLVSIITDIISDGRFDGDTERILLESAILNYNDAYTKYHEVANKSMDSINDKKVNDAKSAFSKEVEDLNNALGNLEGTMNDAFKQGVLSDAEKISIKQGLKNIENEKSDVDAKYVSLYENPDLIGEAKINLKNSYDSYILKYDNLVSVVDNIINKNGIIDSIDQNKWNDALKEYRAASADFNKKGNDAINSISKKQSKDAEENAKSHTNSQIKINSDSILNTVSTEYYKKDYVDNELKWLGKEDSRIEQKANEIKMEVSKKVGIEEVKSTLRQDSESLNIGFNGIDNRVVMTQDGLFCNNTSGRKSTSLKRGNIYQYNQVDNLFLGGYLPRVSKNKGLGLAGSKHCEHFLISHAPQWDNDDEHEIPGNIIDDFWVNFKDKGELLNDKEGIHLGRPTYLWGDLRAVNAPSMTGFQNINSNNILFNTWRKPGSFEILLDFNYNTNAITLGKSLNANAYSINGADGLDGENVYGRIFWARNTTKKMFYTDGYNVYNQMNWDWGGYNLLDPTIIGGKINYSLDTNPEQFKNKSYITFNQNSKILEIDLPESIVDTVKENEDLKRKQEIQEKEIVTSMLASVSIYENMLEFTPQTLNLRNASENPIIDVYISLIRKKVKTLKDIPEILKEQVELKLKNNK